jgi:hypothetical protein
MGPHRREPWDFLALFWDDIVLRQIIVATNRYALTTDSKTGKLKCGPRWEAMTIPEFMRWLGICMLMSLKCLPSIRDYWRLSQPDMVCPVISSVMTRERFEAIIRCLYLTNKDLVATDRNDANFDPLAKCRLLLETLCENFHKCQNPDEYLCVDECMVAYAGRYCPCRALIHRAKMTSC